MKIKVTTPILGYDDKALEIRDEGAEESREYLVRDAIISALNNQLPNEVLTAEQKARIYHVTTKVYKGNEADLSIEELSLVKERAGQILTPVVYGRLLDIIDPK